MMITNMIFILIIVSMILAAFIWTVIYITDKYLIPKNNIKELELKNETYNLFAQISVEKVNEYINNYFEEHVKQYIAMKFVLKRQNYIKESECDILVKDLTKVIYIEISELYLFYIRMIYKINTDEDLLKFINIKVKNIAIDYIASFNSSNNI